MNQIEKAITKRDVLDIAPYENWNSQKKEFPPNDYLKHYRAIRKYMSMKYEISEPEFEMIIFLHSEKYFSIEKFRDFEKVMSWNPKRFYDLKAAGWIQVWREKSGGVRLPLSKKITKRKKTLFCLSEKGRSMVFRTYNLTNANALISESPRQNKAFLKSAGFAKKMLRDYIIKMNIETRSRFKELRANFYKPKT